jgi:hypothetical protein
LARTAPGSGGDSAETARARRQACSISVAASAGMRCCSPSMAWMLRRSTAALPASPWCARRPRARGLSVSLHKGLADALPYPDAGFDYVLSWNVIHHGTLGDLGRRLGCCRRRYCRPAMRITALAARSRPTPSSSTRSSEKATRIAIAMPRRSSVCSPALICSPSASNCSSGDPARTIGTSSPNVATETSLRGNSTVRRLVTRRDGRQNYR